MSPLAVDPEWHAMVYELYTDFKTIPNSFRRGS